MNIQNAIRACLVLQSLLLTGPLSGQDWTNAADPRWTTSNDVFSVHAPRTYTVTIDPAHDAPVDEVLHDIIVACGADCSIQRLVDTRDPFGAAKGVSSPGANQGAGPMENDTYRFKIDVPIGKKDFLESYLAGCTTCDTQVNIPLNISQLPGSFEQHHYAMSGVLTPDWSSSGLNNGALYGLGPCNVPATVMVEGQNLRAILRESLEAQGFSAEDIAKLETTSCPANDISRLLSVASQMLRAEETQGN